MSYAYILSLSLSNFLSLSVGPLGCLLVAHRRHLLCVSHTPPFGPRIISCVTHCFSQKKYPLCGILAQKKYPLCSYFCSSLRSAARSIRYFLLLWVALRHAFRFCVSDFFLPNAVDLHFCLLFSLFLLFRRALRHIIYASGHYFVCFSEIYSPLLCFCITHLGIFCARRVSARSSFMLWVGHLVLFLLKVL